MAKKRVLTEEQKARARERKAKWLAANHDKNRRTENNRRAANPEKVRQYRAKWRAANLDKEREKSAKWRAANLEKLRKQARSRYAAHPEKAIESLQIPRGSPGKGELPMRHAACCSSRKTQRKVISVARIKP